MKLTKSEAVREHRKMWNWIADETEKRKEKVEKEDYFIEVEPYCSIREEREELCWCCEYVSSIEDGWDECWACWACCPIVWPNRKHCIYETFGKWDIETNWKRAAELARQIANLPERPDMEFDILEDTK